MISSMEFDYDIKNEPSWAYVQNKTRPALSPGGELNRFYLLNRFQYMSH